MLIDSHCHLDFPDFDEDGLDAVVARAHAAGVAGMVTICTRVTAFDRIKAVAEAYDSIWCSVGIHPHNADSEPETTAAELVELSQHPKVVGIGETGLDYFYEKSPREPQRRAFRAHIQAARETGLPVIIHTRAADEDTIDILRDEHARGPFPGLLHCFTTAKEVADVAIDLGLYVSLSGIVTFKNAEDLRETVKSLPLNRILVETDAPYLAPIPERGRRNEPAFTVHTAAKVAELQGVTAEELADATTENFFRLFTRADRAVLGAQ